MLPTPVTLPCGSLRVVSLDQRSAKQKRSLHVQQGVMTGEHIYIWKEKERERERKREIGIAGVQPVEPGAAAAVRLPGGGQVGQRCLGAVPAESWLRLGTCTVYPNR